MTANTEKKPVPPKASSQHDTSPLKGVLADVLKKTEPKSAEKPPEKSQEKPVEKKPFEVPEDTLKAIFKDT